MIILLVLIIFPKFTNNTPRLNNFVSLGLISLLILNINNLISYYIIHGTVRLEIINLTSNLSLELATEPLGLTYAALASYLWLATHCYNIGYLEYDPSNIGKTHNKFYRYTSLSMCAVFGIALAGNLFTLLIFYELLTLFIFPLIYYSKETKAMKSAEFYLLMMVGCSIAFLIPAIIITYNVAGHLQFQSGGNLENKITHFSALLLMLLYIAGVAKVAIMPFHSWLPRSMVAQFSVSTLFYVVSVAKAGVFTIIKIIIYIFGSTFFTKSASLSIVSICSITIIISSIIALKKTNLKLLLAYSTISQLAFSILAVGIMTPKAIIAAIFHMVAHALAKIVLFFATGAFYITTSKTTIKSTKGLAASLPIVAICFSICATSIIGLPPLIGFFSKYYILSVVTNLDSISLIVIITYIISTLLSAAYFIPIIYNLYESPAENYKRTTHKELPLTMMIPMISITIMVSLLFLFGNRLINFIELVI
jgi:multicomponent Na+:H+ antiporter subunit D